MHGRRSTGGSCPTRGSHVACVMDYIAFGGVRTLWKQQTVKRPQERKGRLDAESKVCRPWPGKLNIPCADRVSTTLPASGNVPTVGQGVLQWRCRAESAKWSRKRGESVESHSDPACRRYCFQSAA
jgi:hypothetical protein